MTGRKVQESVRRISHRREPVANPPYGLSSVTRKTLAQAEFFRV
jgi:hypothetical protein